MAAHAVRLDCRCRLAQPRPVARVPRARTRHSGLDQCRLACLFAVSVKSVSTPSPRSCRRARPEPSAARPRHGAAPAIALHGLCGLCGAVRIRHGRIDFRRDGRRLGALVALVDLGRLGLSHARHLAGQRMGLLCARLGRLVVLGSGRERIVHALVVGHSPRTLADRDGSTGRLPQLVGLAGHRRVLLKPHGHLLGALGRAYLRPRFCSRSGARPLHSVLHRSSRRQLAVAVCMAGTAAWQGQRHLFSALS